MEVTPRIRLTGFPLECHQYVVAGKSPIDWVLGRYACSTDAPSGIQDYRNGWLEEPDYILDLLKKVVRVRFETVRIVRDLASLDI